VYANDEICRFGGPPAPENIVLTSAFTSPPTAFCAATTIPSIETANFNGVGEAGGMV